MQSNIKYYLDLETKFGFLQGFFSDKGISKLDFHEAPQPFPIGLEKCDKYGLAEQIKSYENGSLKAFDIPLDISATKFQLSVFELLLKIPFGRTSTYLAIADLLGNPKGSRAVGSACGKNNLTLLIPCHRVIKTSGDISGYKWSCKVKKMLLEHEKTC